MKKEHSFSVFNNNLDVRVSKNGKWTTTYYKTKLQSGEVKELSSWDTVSPTKIQSMVDGISGNSFMGPDAVTKGFASRFISEPVIESLKSAQVEFDAFMKRATDTGTRVHLLAESGEFDNQPMINQIKRNNDFQEYREDNGIMLTSFTIGGDELFISYKPDLIIESNPYFNDQSVPYDIANSWWTIVDYKVTNNDYKPKAVRQLTIGAAILARVISSVSGGVIKPADAYNNINIFLIQISKPRDGEDATGFVPQAQEIVLSKPNFNDAVSYMLGAAMLSKTTKVFDKIYKDPWKK